MLIQVVQFLWFFSTFILLPVTIVVIIGGILMGRVTIHVEEGPSAFERGQPNPYVNADMRWLKERDKLIKNTNPHSSTQNIARRVNEKQKTVIPLEGFPIIAEDWTEDIEEESTIHVETQVEKKTVEIPVESPTDLSDEDKLAQDSDLGLLSEQLPRIEEEIEETAEPPEEKKTEVPRGTSKEKPGEEERAE